MDETVEAVEAIGVLDVDFQKFWRESSLSDLFMTFHSCLSFFKWL